jgi:hypothetical protein
LALETDDRRSPNHLAIFYPSHSAIAKQTTRARFLLGKQKRRILVSWEPCQYSTTQYPISQKFPLFSESELTKSLDATRTRSYPLTLRDLEQGRRMRSAAKLHTRGSWAPRGTRAPPPAPPMPHALRAASPPAPPTPPPSGRIESGPKQKIDDGERFGP